MGFFSSLTRSIVKPIVPVVEALQPLGMATGSLLNATTGATEMMQANQAYNDPASQMQRLKEAGLNPNLIYGNSAGGAAGNVTGTTGSGGGSLFGSIGNIMGLMSGYQNYRKSRAEADIAEHDAAATTALPGVVDSKSPWLVRMISRFFGGSPMVSESTSEMTKNGSIPGTGPLASTGAPRAQMPSVPATITKAVRGGDVHPSRDVFQLGKNVGLELIQKLSSPTEGREMRKYLTPFPPQWLKRKERSR